MERVGLNQVKVGALTRWEWQAGDQEKYWQSWQWDGKPGTDPDSTELKWYGKPGADHDSYVLLSAHWCKTHFLLLSVCSLHRPCEVCVRVCEREMSFFVYHTS